jgi:hypothetical protein
MCSEKKDEHEDCSQVLQLALRQFQCIVWAVMFFKPLQQWTDIT